jgi:hypothetical protein
VNNLITLTLHSLPLSSTHSLSVQYIDNMAAEQSPEPKELSLVGKVEMRIALADGDQKLQATLDTYLAPLLLKLASEHMSVRNKVCTHIIRGLLFSRHPKKK